MKRVTAAGVAGGSRTVESAARPVTSGCRTGGQAASGTRRRTGGRAAGGARARDAAVVRRVASWFGGAARGLPWRTTARDPYVSLVSEAMLQQTQVSRVLEKFGPFMARFPTVRALAEADEHDVLTLWSGLGYYRRARHLHAAARRIVAAFGGRVPADVEALRTLPGVGRYTAGAIASLVYGAPEPIVDGNVARVLLRVEGRTGALNDKPTMGWAWERAGALVARANGPAQVAAFNEGLMELGATVCVPASPRCDACPLRTLCVAAATGRQDRIPSPRERSARKAVHHGVVLIRDGAGRTLVERRPSKGLWAGLWQPITIERDDRAPTRTQALAAARAAGARSVHRGEGFTFHTTHREVRFSVWTARARASDESTANRRWATASEIAALPLSNAHRRILLGDSAGTERASQ